MVLSRAPRIGSKPHALRHFLLILLASTVVAGGRLHVRVPHRPLHLHEVVAVLDEARGEGAAQVVRRCSFLSGDREPFLENQGDGGFREALLLQNVPAPEDSREKRSVLLSAEIQPDKEEVHCRLGQIDLAFLVSLADQRNGAFVEVQVGENSILVGRRDIFPQ